ncbi:MAG: DNA repair protein RecO [Acidobacteriota bacterium]
MGLIETESLVLRSYNLAEADRIVLFLTSDHGLVRGVAKGAKRLKSKFGSSLEPFSIVKLTYFQKDSVELVSIQNVELFQSYFELSADPLFLQKFAYLGDLLTSITPPDDPNHDLYRMVKACLDAAAKMPSQIDNIGMYFELWLLRLGGYLPDWRTCEKCRNEIDASEAGALQQNFQLICTNCKRPTGGTMITGEMRRLFAQALRSAPIAFAESSGDSVETAREISMVLRRILSQASGKNIVGERSLVIGN